jgi:serine/threonine-protein kinase
VAQLGSAHLPRYHDFGRLPGGNPFAVMEYLEGETLEARIQRSPLTLAEAAALLGQVAEVLEEAHGAGIVHRDIKPENLFLTKGADGRQFVKVLDFGIAKLTERSSNARLTQAGLILGTPQFAPPEQLVGDEVGVTADIYALGATAFEMLSGRPAFDGEVARIIQAKLTRDAPRLENVPPVVADSVARMMAREPGARPASMAEVRELLSRWTEKPEPPPSRRSRRGYFLFGAAALLLATAIGVGVALHGAARPAPHASQPRAVPAPARPVAPPGPVVIPRPAASPAPSETAASARKRPKPRPTTARASRPAMKPPRVARPPKPAPKKNGPLIVNPF